MSQTDRDILTTTFAVLIAVVVAFAVFNLPPWIRRVLGMGVALALGWIGWRLRKES